MTCMHDARSTVSERLIQALVVGFGICAFVPVLYAQADSSQVEEVIVVASQIPLASTRVTSAVTVLDEAALKGYGNQSLAAILGQQPAISLSRNGGPGQAASLRIRGEEGYRTLTMIDGIRVSDPGSTQIATLPEHLLAQGLARVEILRGPQGLSYGADAGGVVMLQTRLPTAGWQSALDVQSGRYGTAQYAGSVAVGGQRGGLAVQLTQLSSEGFNARVSDALVQDNDGYRNFSGHLNASYHLSDSLQADLVYRNTRAATGYDGCLLPSSHACSTDYTLQAARAGLRYSGAASQHSFGISQSSSERDFYTAGSLGFATLGKLSRAEYLGSTDQFAGMTLVFGGDYEQVDYAPVSRNNTGLFIEYLSNTDSAFTVNAGYRFDSNSESGPNSSMRLGAAWQWDAVRLKAAYGTGFRAASPYEISYNSGSFAAPPAAGATLDMERSAGYEAGIQWLANRRLTLEAIYFRQSVVDAIYFDLVNYSGYLQESGTSVSRGVEINTRFEFNDRLFAAANVSWNPTIRSNGQPRLRRPEQLANLVLGWQSGGGRLQAQGAYRVVRKALDEVNGRVINLDNFAVLDLNVSLQAGAHLSVYSRFENVLNERYEEVAGYNMPGASITLGFNLSLAGS